MQKTAILALTALIAVVSSSTAGSGISRRLNVGSEETKRIT
jgi:hypothetical protein